MDELICLQKALKELVSHVDPELSKTREEFFVGFEGRYVYEKKIMNHLLLYFKI